MKEFDIDVFRWHQSWLVHYYDVIWSWLQDVSLTIRSVALTMRKLKNLSSIIQSVEDLVISAIFSILCYQEQPYSHVPAACPFLDQESLQADSLLKAQKILQLFAVTKHYQYFTSTHLRLCIQLVSYTFWRYKQSYMNVPTMKWWSCSVFYNTVQRVLSARS